MSSDTLTTVQSLWRYPVKSMQGESLTSSQVESSGLAGDRVFALLDETTGIIVSAKNPKKWPTMFAFQSSYESLASATLIITLPDGTQVKNTDAHVDEILSATLGRKVRLISQVPDKPQLEEYWPDLPELDNQDIVTDEAMPVGTFFDLANLHLVTTATLAELQRLYPTGRFDSQRFRPNIILKTDATGFVESEWIGKTLAIGSDLKLKITDHCPRCVMTTLAQGDLPKDTQILRTAAQHNQAHVGVYAEIIQAGTVHCDDHVLFC